jgi:hypothetical protein
LKKNEEDLEDKELYKEFEVVSLDEVGDHPLVQRSAASRPPAEQDRQGARRSGIS